MEREERQKIEQNPDRQKTGEADDKRPAPAESGDLIRNAVGYFGVDDIFIVEPRSDALFIAVHNAVDPCQPFVVELDIEPLNF